MSKPYYKNAANSLIVTPTDAKDSTNLNEYKSNQCISY